MASPSMIIMKHSQSRIVIPTPPVNYVLRQAAIGSEPRSLQYPNATNGCNIAGFLNLATAACNAKVKRFTYAASSTYGDRPARPCLK